MARESSTWTEIREAPIGSWFDPASSWQLATSLNAALQKRCKGRRFLFLTLTYDRSHYGSPLELYRAQAEERHVRRFIARLQRLLGVSLRGKWIRKLEFQDAEGEAWPHFHLLLEHAGFVDNASLSRAWGHGFVNVKRATSGALNYFAKYFSKSGAVPAWILNERPRSVKVVACSPGFWGVELPGVPRDPTRQRQRLPLWIPLGERLSIRAGQTMCRERGARFQTRLNVPFHVLLSLMERRGVRARGAGRWMEVPLPLVRVRAAATAAQRPSRRPLNSINTSNPPTKPPWLLRFLEATGALEWVTVQGNAA